MIMSRIGKRKNKIINKTLEELVPQNHLVRKLENCIDFRFIEEEVKHLYSSIGAPSIPPVILFKMAFINIIFDIHSMRKTAEECQVNVAYRWFLHLEMDETIPNFSTFSQNYRRKYQKDDIFYKIFVKILKQTEKYGLLDYESIYIDSTHQKANANKNKHINTKVELIAKSFEEELLEEINTVRKSKGQKEFSSIIKEELVYDEKTGESKKVAITKQIKESKTDPESGYYHKGEKEKMFAYSHHVAVEKNGFVVHTSVMPGNVHDSVSFFPVVNSLKSEHSNKGIKNLVLDAAYFIPAICRDIIKSEWIPLMPYVRPRTKKGFFKKYDYVYDEYFDCYICPNNHILTYHTTDKQGYKHYKSEGKICEKCPDLHRCTQSKTHQKVITRHVWEEYKEITRENRYTQNWKENYPLRKETIERCFGECKEHHTLRFTRFKGIQKNQDNSYMIFASYNLKKMALKYSKKPKYYKKKMTVDKKSQ